MIFLKIFFILLGGAVVMGTAASRFFEGHWFIRALDVTRIQTFLTGVLSIVGFVFFGGTFQTGEWLFLILLVISTGYQAYRLLPYTPFYPKRVGSSHDHEEKHELSILVFNVLMTNRKYRDVKKLILEQDADIVLLLEPDDTWRNELSGIEEKYPQIVACPLKNLYGMILYSKLQLHNYKIKFLIEKNIPSIHTWIELRSGERVMFRGVHPRPPIPPKKNDRELAMRNELYKIGETTGSNEHPVIVAGDLNDVSWSRTSDLFQKDSGLFDVRIGRGYFNTFNSKYFLIRWPLDHLFVSRHFRVVKVKRLRKCGSDHFPLYVKLALAD